MCHYHPSAAICEETGRTSCVVRPGFFTNPGAFPSLHRRRRPVGRSERIRPRPRCASCVRFTPDFAGRPICTVYGREATDDHGDQSTKTIDPVEAALSAVEEALKLDSKVRPAKSGGSADGEGRAQGRFHLRPGGPLGRSALADPAAIVKQTAAPAVQAPAPAPKAKAEKSPLHTPEPANDPTQAPQLGQPRAAANDDRAPPPASPSPSPAAPPRPPMVRDPHLGRLAGDRRLARLDRSASRSRHDVATLLREPRNLFAIAGLVMPVCC